MSGVAQGGGDIWGLLGIAKPAATSESTYVQDMVRRSRLGTPIFRRRLGRVRESADDGGGEVSAAATAATQPPRLYLAAADDARDDAETRSTLPSASAPPPAQAANALPLLASVAGRSLPSVQMLSRVRVIVPLYGPALVARLPWLASAVTATGGSAAPLLQLVRLAAEVATNGGDDVDDDDDHHDGVIPYFAADRAPSNMALASSLFTSAAALRPVHLAAALALPLAEPSLRLSCAPGNIKDGGEPAACLSAELLAASTYYAYPADWWSPGLLAATVGTAQRLQASVLEEWRKTVVAQQAAASRDAAAAQAQAIMSGKGISTASSVPRAHSDGHSPGSAPSLHTAKVSPRQQQQQAATGPGQRSRLISVSTSAAAAIRADTWGRTSTNAEGSVAVIASVFAAKLAMKATGRRAEAVEAAVAEAASVEVATAQTTAVESQGPVSEPAVEKEREPGSATALAPVGGESNKRRRTRRAVPALDVVGTAGEAVESPLRRVAKRARKDQPQPPAKSGGGEGGVGDVATAAVASSRSLPRRRVRRSAALSEVAAAEVPQVEDPQAGKVADELALASPKLPSERAILPSAVALADAQDSGDNDLDNDARSMIAAQSTEQDLLAAVVQSGWWQRPEADEAEENMLTLASPRAPVSSHARDISVKVNEVKNEMHLSAAASGSAGSSMPFPEQPRLPGWWPGVGAGAASAASGSAADAAAPASGDTASGTIAVQGTIDSGRGLFKSKYISLAGGKPMAFLEPQDRRPSSTEAARATVSASGAAAAAAMPAAGAAALRAASGRGTFGGAAAGGTMANSEVAARAAPVPRAPLRLKASEWDATAEWTRRVMQWQQALLSAYASVILWQALAGSGSDNGGGRAGTGTSGCFSIRFAPHETAGNVVLVASRRWLLHCVRGGGDAVSQHPMACKSPDVFCILFRSSRALRARLAEAGVVYSTPADPGLPAYDAHPSAAHTVAAATDLSDLLRDADAVKELSRAGISIENVHRLRALQGTAATAVAAAELSGGASAKAVTAAAPTAAPSDDGAEAGAPVAGAGGAAGIARDRLRGTPESPSSMLLFSGAHSVGAIMQCLLESVCPTMCLPLPAGVSLLAARGSGGGARMTAAIPLSLFATPSAGANAVLRAMTGTGAAERHVDVPQILSCAPFLHASMRRLSITTRRRMRTGAESDAAAAACDLGSLELDLGGGPVLPGVLERVSSILTRAVGVASAQAASLILEPHLATARDFGGPDADGGVPSEVAPLLR